IYNEDREPMPDGAAFNVAVVPDPDWPVHRATPGNTAGNSTYLDIPPANGNPDVQLLITRTRNSGDEYNDHPVGVWYDSGRERWAIYNEDREPMPDGAAFNVAVSNELATAEPDSSTSSEATGSQTTFVHRAASGNINENSTYMDDPLINGDPEAQLLITRNWNPGGEGGTYNDHPIGVWYDSGRERWAIYNEDREPMPEGVAFNVAISKADRMSSEEVASRDTGEVAKSNAGTGEKPADGTETDDLPEGIPEYQDFYAGGNPETPADLISGNSSVGTIPPVKPFNFGRDPGGPDDKTLYLTIPALDMEGIPVFDTLSEEKLRDGTVHIPATGYPWQDGANVFIAGHRIGYPNTLSYYVFYRLDQLAQGDEILLQDSSGREFEYRVTEQKVVGPENVDVMNAVEDRSIISLQTCTLPDYEERLIVRGELVKKNT
ncbi:MAG: sortase, partial [Rubrobacteraceae bacterium]